MTIAKPLQRLLKPIALTSILISLTACGGGGGGGGGGGDTPVPPPQETVSVSGSIDGATIIAVEGSGNIVATDDTEGRARDVDTNNDGTPNAFSFTLANIPIDQDIRIYLVTNAGIYSMHFDTNNSGVSDSNVFSLASGSTGQLALGFIDTETENGRAIPSNNPVSDDNVTNKGLIAVIPRSINEPPTVGLSVSELNVKGQGALASGWVLGAKTYYQAAVDLAGDSSGNDVDVARFMLALTRTAALGFDTLSDGDAEDIGHLGDLLDLFGIANDNTRANWDLIDAPYSLPKDSPTGNDVSSFSYNVVVQELQAATKNLDDVSSKFDTVFTHDDEVFNVDHGDALFFSGLLNLIKGSLEIQRAYNFDIDIADVENNNRTLEDVHNADSTLLGSPNLDRLAEAKASLRLALERLKSAIGSINSETDDQSDDLIALDATVDEVEINTWIDEALSSIDGDSTNIETVSVNLQAFFDNGVLLDDSTLPGIVGNGIDPNDSDFDEPTFGGVIIDTDTTEIGVQTINTN
jgi:hypothetical protein